MQSHADELSRGRTSEMDQKRNAVRSRGSGKSEARERIRATKRREEGCSSCREDERAVKCQSYLIH